MCELRYYRDSGEWRARGLSILPEYARSSYSVLNVGRALARLEKDGLRVVWADAASVIARAEAVGFVHVVWDGRISEYIPANAVRDDSWGAWAAATEECAALIIVMAQTRAQAETAALDGLVAQARDSDVMARHLAAWLTEGRRVEEKAWMTAPAVYTLTDFA
jgi:hypothetical protein